MLFSTTAHQELLGDRSIRAVNLISDSYINRTFRPKLFVAGVVAMAVSLILMSFDSYWEPVVYEFLRNHESLSFVIGFVPYFGNLAMFIGIYLFIKAKQRPSIVTEDEIRRDGL